MSWRARSDIDCRVALQRRDLVEGEEALLEEAHHRDVLERQRAVGDRRPERLARSPAAACRRPAAIVSGIVPGKRALTSSSAGSPAASSLTCTLATVVSPISSATSRAKRSSASSCSVRPVTAIPESTFSRSRGTTPSDAPVRAGEHVERVLRARQELLHEQRAVALQRRRARRGWRSSRMPREPLPERGLTITGSATAAGSKTRRRPRSRARARARRQRSASAHLSRHVRERVAEASTSVDARPPRTRRGRGPAAAARCRRSGRRRRSCSGSERQTARTKRGSSPRGRIDPRLGSTRYRPAAYGSMSAEHVNGSSASRAGSRSRTGRRRR